MSRRAGGWWRGGGGGVECCRRPVFLLQSLRTRPDCVNRRFTSGSDFLLHRDTTHSHSRNTAAATSFSLYTPLFLSDRLHNTCPPYVHWTAFGNSDTHVVWSLMIRCTEYIGSSEFMLLKLLEFRNTISTRMEERLNNFFRTNYRSIICDFKN